MSTYTVVLSESAKQEFDVAYEWLARQTPQHAPIWYNAIIDALLSLEEYPLRCPLIHDESITSGFTRVLIVGTRQHAYRILYSIHDNSVIVHHIRHAARGY